MRTRSYNLFEWVNDDRNVPLMRNALKKNPIWVNSQNQVYIFIYQIVIYFYDIYFEMNCYYPTVSSVPTTVVSGMMYYVNVCRMEMYLFI